MPQEGEMTKPKPPANLADAGQALWESIVGGETPSYHLRPDEAAVLMSACKAADVIADLEKEWEHLGRPFESRGSMGQPVEHFLITAMTKQRTTQARFLAQLKLPDEPGGERPNQQRAAAQSRWAAAHGAG